MKPQIPPIRAQMTPAYISVVTELLSICYYIDAFRPSEIGADAVVAAGPQFEGKRRYMAFRYTPVAPQHPKCGAASSIRVD